MQFPFQRSFQNVSKPSYQLFVESKDKTDVKVRQEHLWMRSTIPPNEIPAHKENKEGAPTCVNQETIMANRSVDATTQNKTTHAHEKGRQSLSTVNHQIPLADRTVEAANFPMTEATTQVHEKRKESPSAAVNHHRSLSEKIRDTAHTATSSALDSQPRKRKIDPTVRSWGKPGPSTWVSEDEEDEKEEEEEEEEEKEYWMKVKRQKKHHLPFANVRL